MAKNPRIIELGGKRFGRWLIIEQAGNQKGGGTLWQARCDCGTERVVIGADVRNGKSISCGCYRDEFAGNINLRHGETGTRLYHGWKNMRKRCADLTNKDYGGRGITVCAEWETFEAFRDWALTSGYSEDLTIERIDVDRGYDPANCTWADKKTQSRNRRFVKRREDGTPWPAVAEANGVPVRIYNWRVHNGWTPEEASSWPHTPGRRMDRVPRGRNSRGQFA